MNHEHNLLRLLYHRNKNQHHASLWWKDLNALKRNLTKLVALLRQKTNEHKNKEILRIARVIKFHIVKDCYRSFNVIIALGQFITMGMVLIGMLARIHGEICKIDGIDDIPSTRKAAAAAAQIPNHHKGLNMLDSGEEIGEEIKPDNDYTMEEDSIIQPPVIDEPLSFIQTTNLALKKKKKKATATATTKLTDLKTVSGQVSKPSTIEKEKKKKKKKKSAIDDIFG